MSKQKIIAAIKKVLRKQPVKLAYLYGSFARGEERKGSDVDVAVVMSPATRKRPLEISQEINEKISGVEIDVRELKQDSPPVFAMAVINESQPLLARDEKERIDFELAVMRNYYDSEKIRRINYEYLKGEQR